MPLTKIDIWPQRFTQNSASPRLFADLSETTFQTLLQNSFIKKFEPNTILIQQGDKPQHLFFIINGTLKTLRSNEEGGEATMRMLQAGETCMEAVIFMGGPSPITVQAVLDTKILLIPENIVRTLALQDSQFSHNLLLIVTHHYKNALQQIDAINIKTPLQRVGYYLLAKHLEQGHTDLKFSLPFQKSLIANYLGMTPETFSRALNKIKDLGINVDDDSICMKDAFVLCHFCDSDTEALCDHSNKKDCPHCPIHNMCN